MLVIYLCKIMKSFQVLTDFSFRVLLLLCLCIIRSNLAQDETSEAILIPAVTFQRSGDTTTESLLRYNGDIPDMTEFSICFRIKVAQFHEVNAILSYAVEGDPDHLTVSISPKLNFEVRCCQGEVIFILKDTEVRPMSWYSLCLSVDLSLGIWNTSLNGDEMSNPIMDFYALDSTIQGGGELFIGQKQGILGGGFSKSHSLRGRLVEFQMWDTMLDLTDMTKFSQCNITAMEMPDPFLSFDDITANFEVGVVDVEDAELSVLHCTAEIERTIIYTDIRQYKDARHFCTATGGYMATPKTDDENSNLLMQAASVGDKCRSDYTINTLWLGVELKEGSWEVTYGSYYEDLDYENFQFQVVGNDSLCGSLITAAADVNVHSGKWLPIHCHQERCFACSYDFYPTLFYLKGLCSNSIFDEKYFMIENDGVLSFVGYYDSEIRFHRDDINDTCYWEITTRTSSARAWLYCKSDYQYPTGMNIWEIANAGCNSNHIKLLFTTCGDEDFTCNSGECISREFRCDVEVDCEDASDEKECQRVIFPDNYDYEKVAARRDYTVPSELGIMLNILFIKDFDLTNFKFTSEADITLSWYDERLKFRNLQEYLWKNKISGELWEPPIDFLGDGETTCDVKENNHFIIAKKEEPGKPERSSLNEDLLYLGYENTIELTRRVTVTASCSFKLFAFPFDVQRCYLTMKLSYPPVHVMMFKIKDEGLKFSGERYLLQYYLQEESMINGTVGNYSSVTVNFVFYNLTTYFLTSTYLPTFILLVIGYLTFFFPIDDFNDRIMVALTALLVEAAFFTQTTESVPQTSYLKMVDIWFVFCIACLFMIMVILVIINVLIGKEEEPQEILHEKIFSIRVAAIFPKESLEGEGAKELPEDKTCCGKLISSSKLNAVGKIIFPVFSGLFVLVYFILAVTWARQSD